MRPKLKYCGNHSLNDLQLTIASKADYLGLIFTKKSRRAVTPEQVAGWLTRVQLGKKALVGVFADDAIEVIERTVRMLPIEVIQCHGSETPEEVRRIKLRTRKKVWKVIHHSENGLKEMGAFASTADGYVIDTKVKGLLGGTGRTFDWRHVPLYLAEAERQHVPCFIAGGVKPANIEKLLTYHPAGIDMSSGIERDFKKDPDLICQIERRVLVYDDQTTAN